MLLKVLRHPNRWLLRLLDFCGQQRHIAEIYITVGPVFGQLLRENFQLLEDAW